MTDETWEGIELSLRCRISELETALTTERTAREAAESRLAEMTKPMGDAEIADALEWSESDKHCMSSDTPRGAVFTRLSTLARAYRQSESQSRKLRERVEELEKGAFKPVADSVLRKIQEIEFKAGRCLTDAFSANNLPPPFSHSDTVTIHRERLKQFRDDYSLMMAYLAFHFKNEHVAPIDLIGPLRLALAVSPSDTGKEK